MKRIKRKNRTIGFVALLFFAFVLCSMYALAQASFASADDSLKRAQNAINVLDNKNLSTDRLTDLLAEAQLHFDAKRYGDVIAVEKEIQRLKDLAFSLDKKSHTIQMQLIDAEQLDYNITNGTALLGQSKEAFFIGNYEFAEGILSEVEQAMLGFYLDLLQELHSLVKSSANKSSYLGIEKGNELVSQVESALSEKRVDSILLLNTQIRDFNRSIHSLEEAHSAKNKHSDVARIADLYTEALISFELGLFEKSLSKSNEINALSLQIEEQTQRIANLKTSLEESAQKGIAVEDAFTLFDKAVLAFENEDYEQSELFLVKAEEELDDAQATSLLTSIVLNEKTNKILQFMIQFWYMLIIMFLVLLLVSILLWKGIKKRVLLHKISKLKKEEPALLELIKKDQTEYFKEKSMSKGTYEDRMDTHHERLLYIKELIPKLQKKAEQMKKG